MRGEQSTSVLNLIQGEWETREIYLAGAGDSTPASRSPWPGTQAPGTHRFLPSEHLVRTV